MNMEWKVKIEQHRRSEYVERDLTETISGTFEDIVDAMSFVNLALKGCEKVNVTISYDADNYEKEEIEA